LKTAACILGLSLAAFCPAFADEPQAPVVQPTAEQPPAATAAVPTTEAKSAVQSAAVAPAKTDKADAADPAATDALIKQMRGRGYKPVNRNGTLVFCRAEGELGTHFERTRCSTIDELKRAEQSGKEYVNSIQQQGSPTQFKGP
jgi:hypothetical protein